jgi:hypothetical protein
MSCWTAQARRLTAPICRLDIRFGSCSVKWRLLSVLEQGMVGDQDQDGRGPKGSRSDGATLDGDGVLPGSPPCAAPAANGESLPPAPRPSGAKRERAKTRLGLGDPHSALARKSTGPSLPPPPRGSMASLELDAGWSSPAPSLPPASAAPAADGGSPSPAPPPPGTKSERARTRLGLGDPHSALTPKTSTAEGADDWLKALIGDVEPVSAPTSASALVLVPESESESEPTAGVVPPRSGPPAARADSRLVAGAVPPPPSSPPPASDSLLKASRPVPPPSAPPIAKTGPLPRPTARPRAGPSTLPRPRRPPAASNRSVPARPPAPSNGPAPARSVPPKPAPPSEAPAKARPAMAGPSPAVAGPSPAAAGPSPAAAGPSPAAAGPSGAPPALAAGSESASKVASPPVALPRQERGQVTSGPSVVVSDGERLRDAASEERRGSRVERWLWAAVVLGGLVVSGYRHDVIFGIAKAMGLGGVYDAAEKSLFGGPVFGTVRSVDALVGAHPIDDRDVQLPVSVTLSDAKKQ